MEINRLNEEVPILKWALTAYLLLASLGFVVAGLMSHQHYGLDHAKTVTYYLGNEEQMAFPKLYAQLLQTAHVHSFTMPLVFLPLWLVLGKLPKHERWKKFFIAGGALSILIYNAAPFLLRYGSPRAAWLFSMGGIGLFIFFLIPAFLVLWELWLGVGRYRRNS